MHGFYKKIPVFLAGVGIIVLMCWFQLTDLATISRFRNALDLLVYDTAIRQVHFGYPESNIKVVIVDIDDISLQQIGRWPWPRNKIAELINTLIDAGAIVIGFDITFSEPEPNPIKLLLKEMKRDNQIDEENIIFLNRYLPVFDYDQKLKESLQQIDSVLGFVFHNNLSLKNIGKLPSPLIKLDEKTADKIIVPQMLRYRTSLPVFVEAASGGGFLTIFPDRDGVLRLAPLVLRYENELYPSLALEMVKRYLLLDTIEILFQPLGSLLVIDAIDIGGKTIPVDKFGQVNIPFANQKAAAADNTKNISAVNILSEQFNPKDIQDSIVLVGSSSLTLHDLHATPVDPTYPGILIHANLIHGLLAGYFPYRPGWAIGAEFLATIFVGLISTFLFPYLSVSLITLCTFLAAIALIYGNIWLLQHEHLVLYAVIPLATLIMIAVMNLIYGYFFSVRQQLKIKSLFGQYVPNHIVEVMSENPNAYGFEGENKVLTVLFSDIRSFTTISESLPVKGIKELLNLFFTPITEVIFNHNGTIDKYVGDMVIAFWGAPVDIEKPRESAIQCALDMIATTKKLNIEFVRKGLPEISIGIGINTGKMNVGDMGSEYRRAYTVLGNSVNLASRLEGLTKYYGVSIIVGEDTRKGIEDYVFILLDKVRVKGKREPTDIYACLCHKDHANSELLKEIKAYEEAMSAYFDKNFTKAYDLLQILHHQYPEKKLYALHLKRIKILKENPPGADWDGIYEWESK